MKYVNEITLLSITVLILPTLMVIFLELTVARPRKILKLHLIHRGYLMLLLLMILLNMPG